MRRLVILSREHEWLLELTAGQLCDLHSALAELCDAQWCRDCVADLESRSRQPQ